MKKSILSLVTLTLLTLSLTAPAWSAIIALSNLPATDVNSLGIANNQWVGREFTTGSSSPSWNLDHVVLNAYNSGNTSDFTVKLYSNRGGKPGSLLSTLTGPPPSGSTANYSTFTDPLTTLLNQNTSYWIVASSFAAPGDGFVWGANNRGNNSFTASLAGWSYASGVAWSGNLGSNWTIYGSDRNPLMEVDVVGGGPAPVPEPSTYALFSLGFGGLALWKRRQQRRNS